MAYRRARPGQAQAQPGLQARARLDPREFGQAGPGFTEAWPAWPVGNTDKASHDLAVEKRAIRQGVEYHPCNSADVIPAEVVRSPIVKKNRVMACKEM